MNHLHVVGVGSAGVSGVGGFAVDRLNDIVFSVQSFISDQLDADTAAAQLLNGEDCHILVFAGIEGNAHHDCVIGSVNIVGYHDVVYVIVTVQVQVVDHLLRIIQAPLKTFERLRILEEVHHGVEVQVVPGQAEIFLRPFACPEGAHSCKQEGEDRGEDELFHDFVFNGSLIASAFIEQNPCQNLFCIRNKLNKSFLRFFQ